MMQTVTWEADVGGTVESVPTAELPGFTRLRGDGSTFATFRASDPGSEPLNIVVRTDSYFAVYVECGTNRGRRQFKFVPTGDRPRTRFGYRYEAGLGRDIRNGEINRRTLELTTVAGLVEPGVVIEELRSVSVRVADEVEIELLHGSRPGPPPVTPPLGELIESEAVRFLNQATFGAGRNSIDELMGLGDYNAWIDRQLSLPVSRTEPYVRANSNGSNRPTRHYIWWDNALTGEDQLRQRMAFALSQVFVVSDLDYLLSNAQYGMADYYDMLTEQALGDFRSLLERMTLHPVMGIYLSMVRNERADPDRNVRPDENYAREILQLFTIGLHELTPNGEVKTRDGAPIASYDQTTVEEFARVFTGWNYADSEAWDTNRLTSFDKTLPMTANQAYHDTGSKTLLGGTTLAPGRTAEQDLRDALDNIFEHANVGPFVSRLLIKQLVTSNPSPAYVGRVAAAFNGSGNENGSGARGDLGAVARAILTDPEARAGHRSEPATFGKVKEPVLRLTQLWRAFEARPGNTGVYRTRVRVLDRIEEVVGQAVMKSPSVFNFYHPDNPLSPDSDLVAPEKEILSEINLASANNMLFDQVYDCNNLLDAPPVSQTLIQLDRELAMADDVERLLDHLDVLLLGGALPVDHRAAVAAQLATHPATAEGLRYRVLDAIFCIVASPFHYIQK